MFQLPYDDWPGPKIAGSYLLHAGYVESEDLHWSYGAMQGRSEAAWQQRVAAQEAYEMIQDLRAAGYDGIYLDTELMNRQSGEAHTQALIADINAILEQDPLESSNGRICFWKITEEEEP